MKNDFYVEQKNNVITRIGKSTVPVPSIKWNQKGIKWYDDAKLLKKNTINK